MKRIDVAVGIIFNQQGEVLIGQRTVNDLYFQKWEFPGGKLEPQESPQQALKRELAEELAIDVQQSSQVMTLEYDYPDRLVRLTIFRVDQYQGEPVSKEGQALQWVKIDQLNTLDMLAGNHPIIEFLQSF